MMPIEFCSTNSRVSTCQSPSVMFLSILFNLFGFSKDRKIPSKTSNEYDFIIVGAGSAGCVLANRLTEIKDWSVLLLEAGSEEMELNSVPSLFPMFSKTSFDWNYQCQPERNASRQKTHCSMPRGRIMGGSSAINGLIYVRGSPVDYDTWAKLGNRGWSYKNVLSYFKKSENNRNPEIISANPRYHSTGGYLSVEKFPQLDENVKILDNAWQEMGYKSVDVNANEQIGVMTLQTTSFNGRRQSTNEAFIRPIREFRSNLFIETEAYVTKILFGFRNRKAIGVRYTSTITGKSQKVMARKEVIISAGAINSPRLLMNSGIGPIKELQKHGINVIKNLPVGQNLQDHVTLSGFTIKLSNRTSTTKNYRRIMEDLHDYYKDKKGPLSTIGPLSSSAFVTTIFENKQGVPDIQYNYIPSSKTNLKGMVACYYDSISILPVLLSPESKGVIKLNDTDPIWGSPLIYQRFFTKTIDRARLIEGIQIFSKLFNSKSFQKNGLKLDDEPWPLCKDFKFNSYNYWSCMLTEYTRTMHDPVGTCKMGPKEDRKAVVNSKLRVHGIKRLRVVDASIMPTIVHGNTNAATIMIAEKASDIIKQDWLSFV